MNQIIDILEQDEEYAILSDLYEDLGDYEKVKFYKKELLYKERKYSEYANLLDDIEDAYIYRSVSPNETIFIDIKNSNYKEINIKILENCIIKVYGHVSINYNMLPSYSLSTGDNLNIKLHNVTVLFILTTSKSLDSVSWRLYEELT